MVMLGILKCGRNIQATLITIKIGITGEIIHIIKEIIDTILDKNYENVMPGGSMPHSLTDHIYNIYYLDCDKNRGINYDYTYLYKTYVL